MTGNKSSAVIQHILLQLALELSTHVNNQNNTDHKTSYHPSTEDWAAMREIKGLANTLRGTIQQLRTAHANATGQFEKAVKDSQNNLEKVKSFTTEMNEANKEVEALLSDVGSNFEPQSELPGLTIREKPDLNGVTTNKR